jgi:hypothetical protein
MVPLSGVRAIIAERMGTSAYTTAVTWYGSDATELWRCARASKSVAGGMGVCAGHNDSLGKIARARENSPYMNVADG